MTTKSSMMVVAEVSTRAITANVEVMTTILFSGILQTFPRLKIVSSESGIGWVPYLMEVADHQWEAQDLRNNGMEMKPSEYFKRQCFVSAESDERFVKQVIEYMGDDHIVFSSDWPHPDSKYPHSVETFLENEISDESKRKLLWDNCARYYGITS